MSALRVALVAMSAAILTAACAAGQHAATADEKPTLDGTQGTIGSIQLEGVSVQAPTGGQFYNRGADAPLTLYVVNSGHSADTLTNVSSSSFTGGWDVLTTSAVQNTPSATPSATAISTKPAAPTTGTPQQIGAGSAIGLGMQNLNATGSGSPETLVLKGAKAELYPGTAVKVTFTFAKAGSTTLTVPVQLTPKPNTATLPFSYSPPAA